MYISVTDPIFSEGFALTYTVRAKGVRKSNYINQYFPHWPTGNNH